MTWDEYQEQLKIKILSSYSKQKPEEIGDNTEEYLIETRCDNETTNKSTD